MNPGLWITSILVTTLCFMALTWACNVTPAAARTVIVNPEVIEMGNNCVYILRDGAGLTVGIAAVPRATAPNYYGRCQ
jgi:hypothetical protein